MSKKFSSILCAICAGSAALNAGIAQASTGNWQDPVGGWQAVWQASSGLLPSQLNGVGTNVTWNNQQPRLINSPGFQFTDSSSTNYAGLATDAVTGEQTMVLRTSNNSINPIFGLNSPPGGGTTTDLITVDTRFRLITDGDPTVTNGSNVFPFFMDLVRPPTAAQTAAAQVVNPTATPDEAFFQIRFRENGFFVLGDDATGAPISFSGGARFNRTWHDIRIEWNVATGGAQFYIDGSATPQSLTGAPAGATTTIFPRITDIADPTTAIPNNLIDIGDAGSGVAGQGSVSYIKVTSSELASTVPEPASAMLIVLGGSALALRRRRDGAKAGE